MLSKIVSMLSLLLLPGISFGNKPSVISSRERFLPSFNIVSCTAMGCGVSYEGKFGIPIAGYYTGTLWSLNVYFL